MHIFTFLFIVLLSFTLSLSRRAQRKHIVNKGIYEWEVL